LSGVVTAIGLMSGTSMDGIDVELLTTDGERMISRGPSLIYPYAPEQRARAEAAVAAAWRLLRPDAPAPLDASDEALLDDVEQELMEAYAEAVKDFLESFGIASDEVAVLGFHGQDRLSRRLTPHHPPARRWRGFGEAHRHRRGLRLPHRRRGRGRGGSADRAGLSPCAGRGGRAGAFDVGPGNGLIDDFISPAVASPVLRGDRM
jgi:1,6-anhydro-N-acetylmuramate kinase